MRPPRNISNKFLTSVLANRRSYIATQSSMSPSMKSLSLSMKSDNQASTSQKRKRYYSQSTVPIISASSWNIMDRNTSKSIYGHNDMQAREVASLTKIMTCILCINLLKLKENIHMNDLITITHRASITTGTTAELKIGDQIKVKDLLYGLMLPSGNDAAIALAEFFGDIISPCSLKPVRKFVAEMNQLARDIGMPNTHFTNPHGLMHKKNLASSRDIARLACYSLKDQVFRDIVNTKSYISEVVGKDGFVRFLH